MSSWKQKLRRSLQDRGVPGTLEQALYAAQARIPHPLQKKWDEYTEQSFDKRWHVDTAGVTEVDELQIAPRYPDVLRYQATPAAIFRNMLRPLRIDYRSFVFVDVGCGKGKIVLLAAGLPFKRVVGVEISRRLVETARKNLRTYRGPRRCSSVEIECVDAADYEIPAEPVVFFAFNPFGETTMRALLERIRKSLSLHPREIFVLYNVPEQHTVLDECGFLTPVRRMRWFSLYRSVLQST